MGQKSEEVRTRGFTLRLLHSVYREPPLTAAALDQR